MARMQANPILGSSGNCGNDLGQAITDTAETAGKRKSFSTAHRSSTRHGNVPRVFTKWFVCLALGVMNAREAIRENLPNPRAPLLFRRFKSVVSAPCQ